MASTCCFDGCVEVVREGSVNFCAGGEGILDGTEESDCSVTDERLFFSGGGEKALSSELACLDVGDGERWRFLPISGVMVDTGILGMESE